MTKMLLGILCAGFCVQQAAAQSVRSLVNGGNDLYKQQKFTDAEVNYRKALAKEQRLVQGHFDLGNALHKQGKYDEAVKEYEDAIENASEQGTKANAYYNIGNSLMKQQRYADAIQSYIESLKINPQDEEAKYNLSYALAKLNQQQQQQKNDDKNKNKNDQKKQNQDQQRNDKRDQQPEQKKQQMAQQQKQMQKAEAERILDVLKNSERDVQRKLRVRQAVRPKTDKDW